MRALSIRQYPLPFASLIYRDIKGNETRSPFYETDYRGQLAIHATKAVKPVSLNPLQKLIKPGSPHYYEFSCIKYDVGMGLLPYGQIIAIAELTDCITMTEEFIASQSPLELAMGHWQVGNVALKMQNIRRLKNPISVDRGWQAWGQTTPEQDELIRSQLNETESEDVFVSDTPEIQPFKVIKKPYGTEYWTHIQAWQARNYDGSLAGYRQGTPDGDRQCTEKKFVPHEKEAPTRYTNYW